MDSIQLGQGHRKGEAFASGSTKAQRRYIDLLVNGQSLKERIELIDSELIGTLGWTGNKAYEHKQLEELIGLRKSDLSSGRTIFYSCPECGDIGCGAITAKIEETSRTIIWRDFGYENDYSEPLLSGYEQLGPFEFDKVEYRQLFEELRAKLGLGTELR